MPESLPGLTACVNCVQEGTRTHVFEENGSCWSPVWLPVLGCGDLLISRSAAVPGVCPWEVRKEFVMYPFSSNMGDWGHSEKRHLQEDLTGGKITLALIQLWKGRDHWFFEHLIYASHYVGSSQLPDNCGSNGIIPASCIIWKSCMRKLKFRG